MDGRGYLARTYYAEVEYILPGAVMQPVWSSVKSPDGSVDFGLSYHRAFYSPDYDDYHDIYIQRFASFVFSPSALDPWCPSACFLNLLKSKVLLCSPQCFRLAATRPCL